ncbi:hypothetical protein JYU09_00125 [bacterium AH-315-O15]|nr:hypothetical protein [bacterium AH-315-O15]
MGASHVPQTGLQQFQHLISSETMFVRGWTEGVWAFPWIDVKWQAAESIDESFDTLPGLRGYYRRVHERAVAFLSALPKDGGALVHGTHLGPRDQRSETSVGWSRT